MPRAEDLSNTEMTVHWDKEDIKQVGESLRGIKANVPVDLAWAANRTATFADHQLKRAVNQHFAITQKNLKSGFKRKKANKWHPVSTITVNGHAIWINSFKVTNPKRGAKVRVLKDSKLTPVISRAGHKGFVRDGHLLQARDDDPRHLRVFWGPSASMMVDNRKGSGVFKNVRPELEKKLNEYTKKRIEYRIRKAETGGSFK